MVAFIYASSAPSQPPFASGVGGVLNGSDEPSRKVSLLTAGRPSYCYRAISGPSSR
jgi:hypothetical protein